MNFVWWRWRLWPRRVEPSLFPSQLLAAVWSSALVLVDLITFHRSAGLPESHPRASPLAVLVLPSWRAGWRPAEHILVLSGAPSVFSASRFNSRACWRWVMYLDLGKRESVLMPLSQAHAQESFPSWILLVNHPRDRLLTQEIQVWFTWQC